MRALTTLLLSTGFATGSEEFGVKLHASASEAGDAKGGCGSAASRFRVNDRAEICVGFEPKDRRQAGGSGSKAVFYPKVDEYSSIAVLTRTPHAATKMPPRYPSPFMPPLHCCRCEDITNRRRTAEHHAL